VKRAVLSVVVLAVALVLQLTVVNRLPLPGAGAPDLVLLAVVALGLAARPATAAVTGFAAGLCLDIAPPGSYLIGEYALVFCLVGYFCGRLRGPLNNMVLPTIAAAMAAAAAGEGLIALLGRAVSDPQVTWAAVRQVLPSSIVYDVLVTPFLLYLVMRALRWADGLWAAAGDGRQADGAELLARSLGGSATRPGGALPGATALGGAGLLGGAGWLAGPVPSRGSRGGRSRGGVHTPRTPRLREAAARSGDGWVGGGPRARLTAPTGLGAGRPAVARRGRPPRLRPGAGTPGSALARPSRTLPRTTVNLRMGAGRRGDGNLVRALGMGAAGLADGVVRSRAGSGPPGSAFRGRRAGGGGPAAAGRAGALAHGPSGSGPKFRPETRLPGGSSSGAAFRAGLPRTLPSRKVNLRLGGTRRHDGVVGGSALRGSGSALRAGALRGGGSALRGNGNGLRGSALRGNGNGLRGSALRGNGNGLRGNGNGLRGSALRRSGNGLRGSGNGLRGSGNGLRGSGSGLWGNGNGLRGSALRGSALRGSGSALRGNGNGLRGSALGGSGHRAGGLRPVSLRLGSGRRGDGVVGGLSGGLSRGRARLGAQRKAAPRFRSGPAIVGHSVLGKRNRLRLGKQAKFGAGRRSFLAAWTGGRLGSRSTVWRIGSKRTGGFR
jgi:rod shape-determining protein MreD